MDYTMKDVEKATKKCIFEKMKPINDFLKQRDSNPKISYKFSYRPFINDWFWSGAVTIKQRGPSLLRKIFSKKVALINSSKACGSPIETEFVSFDESKINKDELKDLVGDIDIYGFDMAGAFAGTGAWDYS